MKKLAVFIFIPLAISLTACYLKTPWRPAPFGNKAPVLDSLVIADSDSASITLAQPTFSTAGKPVPTVDAYIGLNGTISVSGSTLTGSIQGPVDVSEGGYQFSGLNSDTSYRIIVVAKNSVGYSVQQITQSTGSAAPVLNSLSISSTDASSIVFAQPTFANTGNPAPAVEAYIGFNGTISISGSSVSGSLQGPVDVSTGGHQFNGLNNGTSYKIIVVAANIAGYSVKEIVQSTANAAIVPVLNTLSISAFDQTSITISQPSFSITGSPTPIVRAYIGFNDTITVSGLTVSNYLQGPIDVSAGGYQFSGLSAGTLYRIVVTAANNAGYTVQQIVQSTSDASGK
jgi:hypothetical protein